MKKYWSSIGTEHSPVEKLIVGSQWYYTEFRLFKLENGNFVASGMVYDGLVQYEFDDLDEAYAQYKIWRDNEEKLTVERYKT